MFMMDKKEQRKVCKERLASLSSEDRQSFSAFIIDRVRRLPVYRQAQSVFMYRSTVEEVCTDELLLDALREGKSVFLPRIDGDKMFLVPYNENVKFQRNIYGIEEPVGASYEGAVDLAVIPLLGFDRSRARLGRGKGYYDHFLSEFSGKAIALAFSTQELSCINSEAHDVRPQMIVTEKDEICE